MCHAGLAVHSELPDGRRGQNPPVDLRRGKRFRARGRRRGQPLCVLAGGVCAQRPEHVLGVHGPHGLRLRAHGLQEQQRDRGGAVPGAHCAPRLRTEHRQHRHCVRSAHGLRELRRVERHHCHFPSGRE
eukprot:Amastigsp_a841555_73.p5 type:complete len:129 gc:universal Amastigsp_a841555_73:861-475(-)